MPLLIGLAAGGREYLESLRHAFYFYSELKNNGPVASMTYMKHNSPNIRITLIQSTISTAQTS